MSGIDHDLLRDIYGFLPEKYYTYRCLCKLAYYSRAPTFAHDKIITPKPDYQIPFALKLLKIFIISVATVSSIFTTIDFSSVFHETQNNLAITFIVTGVVYFLIECIYILFLFKKMSDTVLTIVEISIKTFNVILLAIHYGMLNKGSLWGFVILTITPLIKGMVAAHVSLKSVKK